MATYTADDGNGGADTATLTLTITPVNDAPVATDDTGTVTEDTPATGNVLPNDTDIDGGALTVTQFVIGGTTFTAGQTATLTGVGTLVINSDGSYTFTPVTNYNGPIPVATYTVSDGNGGTDTATLTLTITPVNDAPVAVDDAKTVSPVVPTSGEVLPNDSDIDGDALTVTQFVINGTTFTAGQTATITGVGTVVLNANGTWTFTPIPGATAPVPVITYTVSDGKGGTDTADLVITRDPLLIIVANDDNFRFTVVNSQTGGNAGNIYTNDTVNGAAVIPSAVTFTLIDNGGLNGVQVQAGNVIIPPGTTPGTYTLTYKLCQAGLPTNCDTATIIVEVGDFGIVVPEGISPDGDGLNDVWYIRGIENYPKNQVTLYNRWGNLIYRRNPYKNDWDGKSDNALTVNGNDRVPAGTYYWVIDLGTGKKLTGFVYVAY